MKKTSPTLVTKTDGVEAVSWIQTLTNGNPSSNHPISLYFHIPFCLKKCPYCHFYSLKDDETLKDELLKAFFLEIDYYRDIISKSGVLTIYFGGGTPFLFGPKRISQILSKLSSLTSIQGCEITLEGNPESIEEKVLQSYREIGINRLSIGAQSFDDDLLSFLERRHSSKDVTRCIDEALHAGFSNISIDLMYDIPRQTLSMWEKSLQLASKLPINHISLYNLTIEPESFFYKKKDSILALQPDESTSLSMYTLAQKILHDTGFSQYEISAFSKPGFQSLHNVGYWNGREFLGFGPSAFSFMNSIRFGHTKDLCVYLAAIKNQRFSFETIDSPPPHGRLTEMIAIGLRMNEGVDLHELEKTFGSIEKRTVETLEFLENKSLISRSTNRVKLTPQGQLLYDSIAVELL